MQTLGEDLKSCCAHRQMSNPKPGYEKLRGCDENYFVEVVILVEAAWSTAMSPDAPSKPK
jgi:hypothetical protein